MNGVQEAVKAVGSQAALARAMGVCRMTVCNWANGTVPVPSKKLITLETISGVPRQRLRPELYANMMK